MGSMLLVMVLNALALLWNTRRLYLSIARPCRHLYLSSAVKFPIESLPRSLSLP